MVKTWIEKGENKNQIPKEMSLKNVFGKLFVSDLDDDKFMAMRTQLFGTFLRAAIFHLYVTLLDAQIKG